MVKSSLEVLQTRVNQEDYKKLCAIDNPRIHQAIAEAAELCTPDKIFICSDTPDEIAHIRNMAIVAGEESAAVAIPGHTFHFDGSNLPSGTYVIRAVVPGEMDTQQKVLLLK